MFRDSNLQTGDNFLMLRDRNHLTGDNFLMLRDSNHLTGDNFPPGWRQFRVSKSKHLPAEIRKLVCISLNKGSCHTVCRNNYLFIVFI